MEEVILAPRDIWLEAIDFEMKVLVQIACTWNISHTSTDFIQSTFPNIYRRCLS